MATAYLSLGSNIEPEHYLRAAILALRQHFATVELSPVYRCRAVGFDGADFLNAAARIETSLGPHELDDWLHALEDAHARDRSGPRFSSRTLDVDLLLYDDLVLDGPGRLKLPRADLVTQAFVLKPMLDLAPELIHPTRGISLRALSADLAAPGDLQKVSLDGISANA
ncbi:MAG TPA: 2-amino-4-hydroxy-6-hydroxymethyldihydropteridine diphosphokinase [Rhodanobacteraceae bacterium]|nr:2-amino-4-hydroxy-6-hydroxymethyldihydropteridine diphosphokinase [Rhodanobacteraceae bacterium]